MALLMALGALIRVKGVIGRPTMMEFDRLMFRVFMPSLLFKNIYEMDLAHGLAWREMAFTMVCLLIIFWLAITIPRRLVRDGNKAAVIGQAMVRGNYLLFGVAVAEALYGEGNAGTVVMLSVVAIPAFNCLAAVILELNRSGQANFWKLCTAILKNPMIIGTLLAFTMKALPFGIPAPAWGVIRSIANSTTTLSFISLGVGLDIEHVRADSRPLMWGILLRMVVIPLVFMPLSLLMGFRDQSLCAMMILFAAPAAVSSYPMAVAMGADGQLAGELVCTTTLLSILTIFLWTFFLHGMGLM